MVSMKVEMKDMQLVEWMAVLKVYKRVE